MVPNGAGPPAGTRPALRARRGAVAGRFTSSLRIIFGRVSMHLPLPPLSLLLLLAAVAAATTTFRPDWNRLQGLARARVEVSAAAPQPRITAPNPRDSLTLQSLPILAQDFPDSLVPLGAGTVPPPSQTQNAPASTVEAPDTRSCGLEI